ncbi:MAG: polysaccharide biosynthesis/export family protein [Planctomycetia bacterium]|nr:polysaccharide biosynthesis/export family protein [Planctomycetia bacterium]
MRFKLPGLLAYCLLLLLAVGNTGCLSCQPAARAIGHDVPRELDKMSLPSYVIEPPDILLIDAIRVVPLPPYKIEPLDSVMIQATNTLPNEPIIGAYGVEPDGVVNLGASYGSVRLSGLTTEQAREAVEKQLKLVLKEPKVQVALAQSRGMQQVRGEHLVRPDGTVGLGAYGSVFVAGMSLDEAKAAIEAHLAQYLLKPEISIDVYAYNSKVFYVIMDGAGYGQQVYRLPITGNETVLDAISQINGLSAVSSKKKIWVARPAPDEHGQHHGHGKHGKHHDERVLPVDWYAIAMKGSTDTNYQLFPGDRIYVQSDRLIAFDNLLAKIFSPIERTFGIALLGQQTILSFDRSLQRNQGNNNGF